MSPSQPQPHTTEGPDASPASPLFRRCIECAALFYEAGQIACPRCRYAVENRPTCEVGYCIDCGWTFRNINGARKRCIKCADLHIFNRYTIEKIMGHVMRFEYQEHWKTKDNRDFMERLAQKVVSGERVYGAPVEHPCIVPTCGKERLYASSECENHDEALNGPLGIIVAGRHRQVSLGRCMRCRVLVGSALNDSPVFVCPFHMMVPAGNDWLERYFHWNESIEQWTMACPVCFIRTHNAKQGEAWNLFVDHLARKHREVALAVA